MQKAKNPSSPTSRIQSERERLGLTVAQFAVLAGVSAGQQKAIEEGVAGGQSFAYFEAIQRIGADPQFIHGVADAPAQNMRNMVFQEENFQDAVDLLRRALQAVEAFVGEGSAAKCPELVAATMNATIQNRVATALEGLEDLGDKLSAAIEGAGGEVAGAIREALESA